MRCRRQRRNRLWTVGRNLFDKTGKTRYTKLHAENICVKTKS